MYDFTDKYEQKMNYMHDKESTLSTVNKHECIITTISKIRIYYYQPLIKLGSTILVNLISGDIIFLDHKNRLALLEKITLKYYLIMTYIYLRLYVYKNRM